MPTILVVDDERKMRRLLQMILEQLEVSSIAAESAEEALELFAKERVDLVLTDLRLAGLNGVELLERIRAIDPDVPVIILTAHATVQTAVAAMKLGAFDYIQKPFDIAAVEITIRNALEAHRYRTENRFLKQQLSAVTGFDDLIGASHCMRAIYDLIDQVAPTRAAVLITGETGTGKELVARAIHRRGVRADKLFVAINCAAIPADLLESELFGHARGAFTGAHSERVGKFELADGGTLFLDEIGDMPYPLQAKLLRVLQEGALERIGSNKSIPVDVRVLSSTNRDLSAARAGGQFRDDLYYRLNVFNIQLPPLRERIEDIGPLAEHFLRQFAEDLGKAPLTLAADGLSVLAAYDWPGNVRELRNLMERAAVLSTGRQVDARLLRGLLPAVSSAPAIGEADELRLEPAIEGMERKVILRALHVANNNKAEAARLLGVSERTLWYKLKRHGL